MKKRILFLIAVYFWFFVMFVLQKPLFMLFHWDIYGKIPLMEWFSVMWNGRPLDFSMAAYLTAIPALFVVATEMVDSGVSCLFCYCFVRGGCHNVGRCRAV